MSRICPRCGKENDGDSKFCLACGTRFEIEAAECPYCGSLNRGDSKFCAVCGNPLGSVAGAPGATVPELHETVQRPVQPANMPYQSGNAGGQPPVGNGTPKKKNTKVIIIAVIVAVVLAAVTVAAVLVVPKNINKDGDAGITEVEEEKEKTEEEMTEETTWDIAAETTTYNISEELKSVQELNSLMEEYESLQEVLTLDSEYWNEETTEAEEYETRTFVMGIDAEYPPFSYIDSDGEYTGFDVDVCRAVCDYLGWDFEVYEINWDEKFINLDDGDCDCIWSGMTALDSYKTEGYVLSEPYFEDSSTYEQYAIAFRQDDAELCAQVEEAIQALVENGTYAEIAAKYPDIEGDFLLLE